MISKKKLAELYITISSLLHYTFSKKPSKPFFNGILIKKPSTDCILQDNYPVFTIDGDAGRIVKFYGSLWRPGKEKWIDLKLDNGSHKHVHTDNVYMVFIYLPLTNTYFPLSHTCYKFLIPSDVHKVFKFRLTNRGYAMFSEDFKIDREHIAKLRKTRYGASFLQRLEEMDYKITKK